MATAANHVLVKNAGATTQGATAKAGGMTTKLTLLGSDGAKLEIQNNGVMIAKSSGGRKIVIKTTNAKASAAAKAATGKAAVGKGAMGAAAMDKAAMAKKVTIMGENGARLEIKRNGLMLAKSPGGREIKIASAKTKPTIMGAGKASAAKGAPMAKAAQPVVAKGGMTKAAMLKAAAAQAALNPGREANVVAANGAKLELKRNGMIQMKTAGGKEVKIAANAKGKLAMMGGAQPGAIKTVAATKVAAPTAAAAVAPPAPMLAPKHAIIAHKGGLVLVNPQFIVPGAKGALATSGATAAKAAVAAKAATASGAASSAAGLGFGLGLGAFGPALLVGAAAVTGFGIYGYVTRDRG